MSKKITFIINIILFLIFTSCSKDDNNYYSPSPSPSTKPYLNIDKDSISASNGVSEVNIDIKTNEVWDIVKNCDWIRVEQKQGKGSASVSIIILDNKTPNDRQTKITVKTATFSKNITIIQNRSNYLIEREHFANMTVGYAEASCYLKNSGYDKLSSGSFSKENSYLYYDGGYRFKCSTDIYNARGWRTTIFISIYFNNISSTSNYLTIDEAKENFLNPYYIAFYQDSFNQKITYSNIASDNFKASKSGNKIRYEFKQFKSVYGSGAWYYIVDGDLYFEFKR